eukprot:2925681-Pleurochrysis_carterae.AAC.1
MQVLQLVSAPPALESWECAVHPHLRKLKAALTRHGASHAQCSDTNHIVRDNFHSKTASEQLAQVHGLSLMQSQMLECFRSRVMHTCSHTATSIDDEAAHVLAHLLRSEAARGEDRVSNTGKHYAWRTRQSILVPLDMRHMLRRARMNCCTRTQHKGNKCTGRSITLLALLGSMHADICEASRMSVQSQLHQLCLTCARMLGVPAQVASITTTRSSQAWGES